MSNKMNFMLCHHQCRQQWICCCYVKNLIYFEAFKFSKNYKYMYRFKKCIASQAQGKALPLHVRVQTLTLTDIVTVLSPSA